MALREGLIIIGDYEIMKLFKKIFCLVVFVFVAIADVYGQIYTVNGTVTDVSNGERLLGASVYIEGTVNGTASDEFGNYEFRQEQGRYRLVCTFIGYDTAFKNIDLKSDMRIDISLTPLTTMMSSVEVAERREDRNVRSTEVGTIDIPLKRIEKLPVMFGEADILKTIQLLPGIQSGGEGSNTYYVRGGGSDQNLVSVDGATVYNPSHAAGFFSVFNSDAVNSAEIIKGGMPPEYGTRMSSVLNVEFREGDKYDYKGKVGVGLLSSQMQFEGPIKYEKSSFIFSARRTYADVVMKPFLSKDSEIKGLGCYFYDLNGKLSFNLSEKDKLTITGFHGKDLFKYKNDKFTMGFDMNWQNSFGVVKWSHIFNKKLYFDVSANVTDYELDVSAMEQNYYLDYISGVRDYVGKTDWTFVPNESNKFKTGVSFTYHKYMPTDLTAMSGSNVFNAIDNINYHTREIAAYIQHDLQVNDWFQVLYGLRYTYFSHIGPFKRFIIDNEYNMNNIDSIIYNRGDVIKSYHLIEPRINTRFQIAENQSIKLSYSLNRQAANLVAMMDNSMPTDIWLPSTDLFEPQLTHQVSTGYFRNFLGNTIEASFEVYYKKMNHLLELNPATNLMALINTNLDYGFISGKGQSYGAEFFVNKTAGQLTGWVSYTLSWTTRNFDEIMNGATFPARYDRRHDVSILVNYELNDKWNFSTVWVFSTGNASTIPNSFYTINGNLYIDYGDHNAWRMPNYHRLDLSATWNAFNRKHVAGNLNFSIYNVYNRKNPYMVSYSMLQDENTNKLEIKAFQISLFPILPSVSFNLTFK